MKKSSIVVGGRYTDRKGNIREVIAEGPEFVAYSQQQEQDNIRYRWVRRSRGDRKGDEANCTRASFAAWAKAQLWGR